MRSFVRLIAGLLRFVLLIFLIRRLLQFVPQFEDPILPLAGFVPGTIVTFALPGAVPRTFGDSPRMSGVVVFASRNEVHVLLDGIRLRRMSPADVTIEVPPPRNGRRG